MTTIATIESRVKTVFAEMLGMAIADIRNDNHIANDLGADDLDLVELVMAIEDEFTIEISDPDWEACLTVQQAIDLVNKLTTA